MASPSTDVGPHYVGNTQKFDENCNTVKAKDLNIVWGKDSRYWKTPANKDDPAELLQVSWLEVTGNVSNTKSEREYEVTFKVSLTADAFGWGTHPIYTMVKRGNNDKQPKWGKMSLANKSGEFDIKTTLPRDNDHGSTKITFGLYEVWSGKWKGGLKIHRVVVKEY